MSRKTAAFLEGVAIGLQVAGLFVFSAIYAFGLVHLIVWAKG